MSDKPNHTLQKLDSNHLERYAQIDLNGISEQARQELLAKIATDREILMFDAQKKLLQSQIAEHDLAVVMDNVQSLNADGKVFSVQQTLETGSGKISLNIKGGDTRFVIPILTALGCIIVIILLIL